MKETKILLGTKNEDKRRELERLLAGCGIRVLSLADFSVSSPIEETGRTFLANAKLKARAYAEKAKILTLADDSGLLVSSLNGRPGVYSARFAGEGCTYEDNNRKLLKLLSGKTGRFRRAKFVCVMALYDGKKFIAAVKGECPGRIAEFARGKNGFGYDPVFIPDGFSRTFAELTSTEKNSISHRAKALAAARNVILQLQ